MLKHLKLSWRVIYGAFHHFLADYGWAIASHIALSTLMALFPFMIVVTALAAFFFGSKDLADEAAHILLEAWPPQVAGPISDDITGVLTNARGDVLPAKVAHRGLDAIAVEQGNHGVRIAGSAVSATPAPITVLHFPVRSRAQFFNKIVAGGAAYARNRDLPPGIGATWRHLYALHQAGELEPAFRKELFSADDVAAGLASGMLVRDERLADTLASLGGAYAS